MRKHPRSEQLRQQILTNAHELVRMKARIDTAFREGKHEPAHRNACAEFHARYDQLAFPGGYSGAFERIAAGDALTLEAAVFFLECRPYFFRSGYMFEKLLRRLKHAPLSPDQHARFMPVAENVAEWRRCRKTERRDAGAQDPAASQTE